MLKCCILALMAAVPLVAAPVWATESGAAVFVANNGNDSGAGTAAAPFATLDRARLAVRALHANGTQGPVHVQIGGGTYYLGSPLVLAAEDSGSAAAPVTYEAAPGAQPVLSGGMAIKNWTAEPDGRWVAHLPDVQAGKWNFAQLFVNGQRRMRPRMPAEGYAHIAGELPRSEKAKTGQGYDRFAFKPGDIAANWTNLHDVEVMTFHHWYTSLMRIETVDVKTSAVEFTGRTAHDAEWARFHPGMRYIVENVKEALHSPGQWYLDRPTGTLTYIPQAGESPRETEVIAPRVEKLIVLQGEETRPVEHLTFRGLSLAHTNWLVPPEGSSIPQAAVDVSGALSATFARHCAVEDCTIQLTGGYALDLGVGCQENRVENCHLSDLGAGGVKVGTKGVQQRVTDRITGNTVRNNVIAHGGRIHAGAVGVWVGQADHTLVEHNDIYDLYYTGISVGWTWGYAASGAHDNTIRFNNMHHLGQAVLSDLGGIYTLGVSPGTTLTFNLIHDVERVEYGGWGIYYDEGSTGIVAENNLIYRTDDGGFHQHYGQLNVFRNNIMGPSRGVQIRGTRITRTDGHTIQDQLAFTFERNIVYGWGAKTPDDPWPDRHLNPPHSFYTLDHNLYWNEGKAAVAPARDKDSIVADPLFIDPAHDDFRLKPDSPAFKLGFKDFDMSAAGKQPLEPHDVNAQRWPRMYAPGR